MNLNSERLKQMLLEELEQVQITDIHTHLFAAEFKQLSLWGIDEILTYHYLIAEFFRYSSRPYLEFFKLPKSQQADLIWKTLFLERSPLSEAQRGTLTILRRLGLDLQVRDLNQYRSYFQSLTLEKQVDTVFKIAGIKEVVMTNDPFDPIEVEIWKAGKGKEDPRFKAALRIDPLVLDYDNSHKVLREQGYGVDAHFSRESKAEVRRFLEHWVRTMDALYLAISLPADFRMEHDTLSRRMLQDCVLPVCEELGIPLALMIGVKRKVHPEMRLAGDSLGKADIGVVEFLCGKYPRNKFLVTMLARENQHELAITARKYRNLMIFGCWWFLNNPSTIFEMTQIRLETLGLSFIPQHSDARVLEQLIYKWQHSKDVIGEVLHTKYGKLLETGWMINQDEIRRDLEALFSNNFHKFLNR